MTGSARLPIHFFFSFVHTEKIRQLMVQYQEKEKVSPQLSLLITKPLRFWLS